MRKSLLIYGVMLVVALLVMHFAHRNLGSALALPRDPKALARLLAIGGLGAMVLLVASYFFEDWFPGFRELKALMMHLFGPCSVPTTLVLSVVTAVAEELLFRGAIQPFAGLVMTSILFGLLHMGKEGLTSAWSAWAICAGLLIGWMFNATGSLWPCMLSHFGVNAVSILSLRRSYRRWIELTTGAASEARDVPE